MGCSSCAQGCGSRLRAHAAAKHNRAVAPHGESCGQPFQVAGPLREHEAMTSALAGVEDVLDDLLKPVVVSDEVAVDGRHPAGRLGLGVAVVGVPGGMYVQHRVRHGSIY